MAYTKVKLPLNTPVYRNANKQELTTQGYELINGYLNDLQFTTSRPGYNQFSDFGIGTAIQAMHFNKDESLLLVVCGGQVFAVDINGAATNITGTAMSTTNRANISPAFSGAIKYYFIASGGKIVATDMLSQTQYIPDVNAPQAATFLTTMDRYLIANVADSQDWMYCGSNSGVIDPFQWDSVNGAGSYSAETMPDRLLAVKSLLNEIYLFGKDGIEVWYNQGAAGDPFSRIQGAFIQRGVAVSAPYAITQVNNTFYFLDQDHHIVRLNGRIPEVIDTPIMKDIQGIDVSGAVGTHLVIKGRSYFMINFVTAGRTFVYDEISSQLTGQPVWYEWTTWNSATAQNENFIGITGTWCEGWNKFVMGGTDGKLYILDPDYHTDNGSSIRVVKTTGHIDHGTHHYKGSRMLHLKLLRGQVQLDYEPMLMLEWNDDNHGKWSNPINIGLGQLGDTETFVDIHALGRYKTRQYRFTITDNCPFSIIDGEEEVKAIQS